MKYIRNKNNKIHKKFTKCNKIQRNTFGIYKFYHANMSYNASTKLSVENWPSDILFARKY